MKAEIIYNTKKSAYMIHDADGGELNSKDNTIELKELTGQQKKLIKNMQRRLKRLS